MKLSVITICLNELEIERTCKSIFEQTFNDFEWIIIDGQSNIQIINKIKKYISKIDLFISEKDSGIYDAMNKGILYAKGEYVSFMNAGDTFYSKTILSEIFEKIFYMDDVIYGNVNIIKNNKSHIENNPNYITKDFFLNGTINHQSCFIKRNLFQKYGLYDITYKYASDYEKFILFSKANVKFRYVNQIIANHYRNGISSDKNSVSIEWKKIQNKYFSKSERKNCGIKYKVILFGLNLLSIKEIFPKKYVKLFGIFTIFKLKKNLIYLFGLNFLPILKLKGNVNE